MQKFINFDIKETGDVHLTIESYPIRRQILFDPHWPMPTPNESRARETRLLNLQIYPNLSNLMWTALYFKQ